MTSALHLYHVQSTAIHLAHLSGPYRQGSHVVATVKQQYHWQTHAPIGCCMQVWLCPHAAATVCEPSHSVTVYLLGQIENSLHSALRHVDSCNLLRLYGGAQRKIKENYHMNKGIQFLCNPLCTVIALEPVFKG